MLHVKEMGVGWKLVRCWMEVKVDGVQGSTRGEPRKRKPRATPVSSHRNEPANEINEMPLFLYESVSLT